MTRPLVLGGAGMLGHKVFQTLRARHPETVATLRGKVSEPPYDRVELLQGAGIVEGVDVADFDALRSLIAEVRPDVVVNCVGVIKQRDAASDAIPSITVNALAPHRIAEMCGEAGARLIHFSTDCVFDGRRGNYTEDDPSDAEDLYGKTKFLGEVPGEDHALTLRSSIVGRELAHFESLLEWFLSQGGGKVRGFTRAMYSGLTTNRMARLVAELVGDHPDLCGLYHVAGPVISKHDLLVEARRAFGLDVEIEPDGGVVIDRTLNASRFEAATGFRPPSWGEMLSEVASDPTPYESWRL